MVGSKASEMSYTNELNRNEYYTDVNYVFNFISEKEKPELLEYMEERGAQTYFTVSTPDSLSMSPMKPLKSFFRWRISPNRRKSHGGSSGKRKERETREIERKAGKGKRYGEI